jgi:hypothetical protein
LGTASLRELQTAAKITPGEPRAAFVVSQHHPAEQSSASMAAAKASLPSILAI